MSRFHWTGKPGNDAVIDLSQLSSSGAIMEGQGKLTYGLKTDSTLTMGDLELADDGDRLNIKGIQGAILAGGDQIKVALQSQKLLALASETSLEAEGLKISADIVDWRTANGSTELQIDSVTMPMGALRGLRLASQSSDNGTSLSSATQIGIREMNAQGQHIEGLELDLALEGLNKQHIETLTQVMESLTQEGTPSEQSMRQTCEAGTGLIQKGFVFKITKIAGKKGEGAISGDLSLEVKPAKSGTAYRASTQIASNGTLLLSHLLDTQQAQQALATGYVSQNPEGLRIAYSLSDGILKVGDRMVDTPEIRSFFKELDQNIQEVFTHCTSALSLTPSPAEPAVQAQAIPQADIPAEDIPVEEESSGGMSEAAQGELSELNRFRAKESMENADAEINKVWKSAPKDRRQAALKDQREWLKLRDKTCRDAAQTLGEGNPLLKDTTQFTCVAEMTRARIETLKAIFAAPLEGNP